MGRDAPEVPVTPLPPGLWSPPGARAWFLSLLLAQEESERGCMGTPEASTVLLGGGGAVDTGGCLTLLIYRMIAAVTAPASRGC